VAPPKMPEIVISGSGDGALQDFLRITTNNKSAEEILRSFSVPDTDVRTLQSAEDLTQRAYHWGATKAHDHEVVDPLHQVHRGLVESLVPRGKPRDPFIKILDGLVRTPVPKITLICSCTHFSNAYGLNRFLTLLIARYLELYRGQSDVLRLGKNVKSVQGINGHTCHGNPITCHGEDHEVELVDATRCAGRPGTAVVDTIQANIVIIRHGIDPSNLPPVPDVMLPRQMMPYHV